MECNLTDLWLRNPLKNGDIPFKPTPYQQAIACCFEIADSARLTFPKIERQIGLTTILAACVARDFRKKKILVIAPSYDSRVSFNRMVDRFFFQWLLKESPNARPTATGPGGSNSVLYATNSVDNVLSKINSRAFDLVVIDEARVGTYRDFGQLNFLYPYLLPHASILIFGV